MSPWNGRNTHSRNVRPIHRSDSFTRKGSHRAGSITHEQNGMRSHRILRQLVTGTLTIAEASEEMQIGERHGKRLKASCRAEGDAALVHALHGIGYSHIECAQKKARRNAERFFAERAAPQEQNSPLRKSSDSSGLFPFPAATLCREFFMMRHLSRTIPGYSPFGYSRSTATCDIFASLRRRGVPCRLQPENPLNILSSRSGFSA